MTRKSTLISLFICLQVFISIGNFCLAVDAIAEAEGSAKVYSVEFDGFKKAAELGDPTAMHNIGIMYHEGEGIAKDASVALEWFKKAAELGVAPSMYNIGVMYQEGEGVAKDASVALEWFKKAAEAGDDTAKEHLARLRRQQMSRKSILVNQSRSIPSPKEAVPSAWRTGKMIQHLGMALLFSALAVRGVKKYRNLKK